MTAWDPGASGMRSRGVAPSARPSTVTSAHGLGRTRSQPWTGGAGVVGTGGGAIGVSRGDGGATDGPTATSRGADGDALMTGEGALIGVGGGVLTTAGDARTGAGGVAVTNGGEVSAGADVTSV